MAQKAIIILISVFLSLPAYSCNWSDISKVTGGYLYPRECHIKVGKSLEELDLRVRQVDELNKALDLNKEALKKEKERGDLWYSESKALEKEIKAQELKGDLDKVLYFVLGAGIMYGASRLGK